MVSKSFTEGFYQKPRVDLELLRTHAEGLIALSACLGGFIPKAILSGDYSGARAHARTLEEIFGKGSFFLERSSMALRDSLKSMRNSFECRTNLGFRW